MKNLNQILEQDCRIIEFASNKSVIEHPVSTKDNFLAVVKDGATVGNNTIALDARNFLKAVRHNSTDVLVLNATGWGESKALHKKTDLLSSYERITLFNIPWLLYFLAKGLARGRLRFNGIYYLKRKFGIAFYLGKRSASKPKPAVRHHLSPLIDISDFFRQLNDKGLGYCILRWFEQLPTVGDGEDIDMLVEDDDLPRVHSIIDRRPGIVPFDIYSKTGLPGADYQGLPYYVHSLATTALGGSVLHKDVFKVPAWKDYFCLLAYHAVFHKGAKSGLSSERYTLRTEENPEHDYLGHLQGIAAKAGLDVTDYTLEGLHAFLDSRGYSPPLDMQYKLSTKNHYLKAYVDELKNQSTLPDRFEGLVCFVAREKVVEAGLVQDLEELIQKIGFTIICTRPLEGHVKKLFAEQVRGGNWNKGPWPSSGGAPSVLIVAMDVYPVKPDPGDHEKHPGLSNKRIQEKSRVRDLLNEQFPHQSEWCNGVHSSDDEIQAMEYLLLAGLDEEEIYRQMQTYKEDFATKYPVIEELTRYSRRAKVELISYKGRKAVIKTFKARCEWFLDNEIRAYKEFSEFEEIPKLLEVGKNYIITEYVEGGRPLEGKVDIKTLKTCLGILRKIYDKGYSLLDFKPANFLTDSKRAIHLIDFEFLHRYASKPGFYQSYDLVGIPDTLRPLHVPERSLSKGEYQYDAFWGKSTGITYGELSRLDGLDVFLVSFLRRYKTIIEKVFRLARKSGIRGAKALNRYMP
ncbi:MAG: hypothetical protein KDI88_01425 [Gammaproteobacteria bacterium]|nr:hypothetical protein [Gammaproteobacteria bacterium]